MAESNVVSILKADLEETRDHLTQLFDHLPSDLSFEIRLIHPYVTTTGERDPRAPAAMKTPKKKILSKSFDTDRDGFARAVKWIERATEPYPETGVYVGVNPRFGEFSGSSKATSADDVALWAHSFVDADEAEAAEAIKQTDLTPTIMLRTGLQPERRHAYWTLVQPVEIHGKSEQQAFTGVQTKLIEAFGADKAIKDIGRIMRLAGTINYPSADKMDRGYKPCIVRLEEPYPLGCSYDDGDLFNAAVELCIPGPSDRKRSTPKDGSSDARSHKGRERSSRDRYSGSHEERPAHSLEHMENVVLPKTHAPGHWHENMREVTYDLVSHYHWPDERIRDFIAAHGRLDGGVHDEELTVLINGARKRSGIANVEATEMPSAFLKRPKERRLPHFMQGKVDWTEPEVAEDDAGYEDEPEPEFFQPIQWIEDHDIKRAEQVHGRFYTRGKVGLTVAAGGVGKSVHIINEIAGMVSGAPTLDHRQEGNPERRVVYWNFEDDGMELASRLHAAAQGHGIDPRAILNSERFFIRTADDASQRLIIGDGRGGVSLNTPIWEQMYAVCERIRPDVIIIDPLANATGALETNDAMVMLTSAFLAVAKTLDLAGHLVHHNRKTGGQDVTVEDARGGSALIGAVRAARTFNRVDQATLDEAMIETEQRPDDCYRADDGKVNFARLEKAVFFERRVVRLPNHDDVFVVRSKQVDSLDGFPHNLRDLLITALANPNEERRRVSAQSKEWLGYLVASLADADLEDDLSKAKVKRFIFELLQNDTLEIGEQLDAKRRPKKIYHLGNNR